MNIAQGEKCNRNRKYIEYIARGKAIEAENKCNKPQWKPKIVLIYRKGKSNRNWKYMKYIARGKAIEAENIPKISQNCKKPLIYRKGKSNRK